MTTVVTTVLAANVQTPVRLLHNTFHHYNLLAIAAGVMKTAALQQHSLPQNRLSGFLQGNWLAVHLSTASRKQRSAKTSQLTPPVHLGQRWHRPTAAVR